MSRPIRTRAQWEADFWAKVNPGPGGCLLWAGAKCRKGYGRFCVHDGERHRWLLAHRVAYALRHGFDALPRWEKGKGGETLTIDHVCRNASCVNADHLRVVTLAENSRDTSSAARASCVNGHPFDAANTYRDRKGARSCKTCRRAANRRWSAAA